MRTSRRARALGLFLIVLGAALAPLAAVTLGTGCAAPRAAGPGGTLPNLDQRTFGGLQLWADVAWREGWRVQRHAWTGHFRLLDADDVRRAWGSEGRCVGELERRAPAVLDGEAEDELVVLLHGLGRTRRSLAGMKATLEADGLRVASLSYPSTRGTIDAHARDVARVLGRLEGVRSVSFVTHSLGGRVVLRLLEREDAWRDDVDVRRVVQLAPPNRGSHLAELASRSPGIAGLAEGLLGPALAELTRPGPLPPDTVACAVIAGARGTPSGWNALLVGDDDGVVAVEETRLDVPHRLVLVRAPHTLLMNAPEARAATLRFLTEG